MKMDLFEAINSRHSYRGAFGDKTVPGKDIKTIIEAGLKAPSGKNAQTTEFVVIDDPLLLREIGAMHTMKAMNDAKAMILCVTDKEPEAVYEGFSFQVEDCSAAVENMLLAITALGYASVWIEGWLYLENRAETIAKKINLPENKVVGIVLPIGEPVEDVPRKKKKAFDERVRYNKY